MPSSQISGQLRRCNYLTSELDALYHEAAFRLGLNDSAMRVLYSLVDGAGNRALSDIYHLTGISKQTVNSALRKLEAEGAIRLENQDGRAKRVLLTETGKALAQNTAGRLIEIEERIFASWGAEELALYLDRMQRYVNEFKEEIAKL